MKATAELARGDVPCQCSRSCGDRSILVVVRRLLCFAALGVFAACSSFEAQSAPVDAGVDGSSEAAPQQDAGIDADGGAGDPIIDLSAGMFFSCSVRASGKVQCWGMNSRGELGVANGDGSCGSTICRASPVVVPDLLATQVRVGIANACAVTKSGDVICWGAKDSGFLGDGATYNAGDKFAPAKVPDVPRAIEVAVGPETACARVNGASTTEVWCWGKNAFGVTGAAPDNAIHKPARIAALDGAKSLRMMATSQHACAIKSDDTVVCWGLSSRGSLGHDPGTGTDVACNTIASCNPAPSPVGTSFLVDRLAVGKEFACARRLGTASIACWGANTYGQIDATPDTDSHATPVDFAVLPIDTVDVEAGGGHVCARTATKKVYCWGLNYLGQIGNGRAGGTCAVTQPGYVCTPTPALVESIPEIARIATGEYHTIAIDEAGEGWGWGWNYSAQLGHPPGQGNDLATCTPTNAICSPRPSKFTIP